MKYVVHNYEFVNSWKFIPTITYSIFLSTPFDIRSVRFDSKLAYHTCQRADKLFEKVLSILILNVLTTGLNTSAMQIQNDKQYFSVFKNPNKGTSLKM